MKWPNISPSDSAWTMRKVWRRAAAAILNVSRE